MAANLKRFEPQIAEKKQKILPFGKYLRTESQLIFALRGMILVDSRGRNSGGHELG
jgi:hypothetical protein